MAFTRFHDDPHRIKKQIDESSFTGRYMLNTPGPGSDMPFVEDTQIRVQKWGANLHTNSINLESDLKGLTRKYNRDRHSENVYSNHSVKTTQQKYNSQSPFVEESRSSNPAWVYRDLEQNRWENPILNPLNGIEFKLNSNIQTRILEKDNFIAKLPVVNGNPSYYLSSETICIGGNEDSCMGSVYNK